MQTIRQMNHVPPIRSRKTFGLNQLESNQLIKLQRDILEIILTNNDYQYALDALCRVSESMVDNAVCTIMLFNPLKTALIIRAAPNLSDEGKKLISGLVPGETSGSCGTAVFEAQPQFVSDTSNDIRWKNIQSLAVNLDIHACWSMPIINRDNEAVGSFALSSFEKREPNIFQQNLLQTGAYLASLVLQRESSDQALQRAAHYDHLTKLPNRFLFNTRLEHAMARANRGKQSLALFYIDLDDFKNINDQFGREVGDEVLCEVAERLSRNIRREDSIARIGGDEFLLLVEGQSEYSELQIIANKILQSFEESFLFDENSYKLSVSIGVSLYPKHGMSANQLISCADKAMCLAKSSNKNQVQDQVKDQVQFYSD